MCCDKKYDNTKKHIIYMLLATDLYILKYFFGCNVFDAKYIIIINFYFVFRSTSIISTYLTFRFQKDK